MKKLLINTLLSSLICLTTYAQANTKEGFEALSNKEYLSAIKEFEQGDQNGEVESTHQLGFIYNSGLGVVKDYFKAADYYRKAANKGYALSMTQLATLYEFGHLGKTDLTTAYQWYLKAAQSGDSYAQYHVGWHYSSGEGVDINIPESIKWYEKSFRNEKPYFAQEAMYNLAQTYMFGGLPNTPINKKIPVDYAKAKYWHELNMNQNHSLNSQVELAEMYLDGIGVPRDEVKAYQLFREAASSDQRLLHYPGRSQYNVAAALLFGIGTNKNPQEGLDWLYKSIENGFKPAQTLLKNVIADAGKANKQP